jgi:hypothetical protein
MTQFFFLKASQWKYRQNRARYLKIDHMIEKEQVYDNKA